jgi:cyclophilin family peptidyl-prolyl cis-trans isomerase
VKRLQIVGLLLIFGVALGACGGDDKSSGDANVTAISAPVEDDIASGCWTAEQRGLALEMQGGRQMAQWTEQPAMAIDQEKTYVATVDTSKGAFDITFFPKDAPVTVNNFVCLAKAGFYDNTVFHRIISGFMIQGGDPTGTGRGGPGYKFADEKVTRTYNRGIVAMANSGPNTNGSQFFVCHQNAGLQPNYTIFGEITSGMDIVDKIATVETSVSANGEKSVPVEPVTIKSVTIAES